MTLRASLNMSLIYIRFCEDRVNPTRKVCRFPSDKPQINRDIRILLQQYCHRFCSPSTPPNTVSTLGQASLRSSLMTPPLLATRQMTGRMSRETFLRTLWDDVTGTNCSSTWRKSKLLVDLRRRKRQLTPLVIKGKGWK